MPGSCSSPSFVTRAHTALHLRLESWPRCASARSERCASSSASRSSTQLCCEWLKRSELRPSRARRYPRASCPRLSSSPTHAGSRTQRSAQRDSHRDERREARQDCSQELEGVRRDLLARPGDADDARDAPAAVGAGGESVRESIRSIREVRVSYLPLLGF